MKQKRISICFSTILGNTSTENETKAQIASYNTFFSSLYASKIPISIHFTGNFLQLLQTKAQGFYDITQELLSKKQIELIGGSYYGPALPLLSTMDIVGQVELYTTSLRRLFSIRPKISYIPYSAWVPSLVTGLKKTGTIEYCLLNNKLFEKSNLSPYAPVRLEDSGKVITSIPIFEQTEMPYTAKDFYNHIVNEVKPKTENSIIVIFLPVNVLSRLLKGENEPSWFDSFSSLVEKDADIDLSTILEKVKKLPCTNKGFIEPNFVQNGELKNASVKKAIFENPYAYKMYQKLMYTSVLISQVRGDKQKKVSALQYLWKAQNSDFFLKAAFNLGECRSLIFEFYKTLLLAEKAIRTSTTFSPSLVPYDVTLNGNADYISQTKNLNAYIDVSSGSIFEYDFLLSNKNYCVNSFDSSLFTDSIFETEKPILSCLQDFNPTTSSFAENFSKIEYTLNTFSSTKKNLLLKANYTYNENPISIRKQFTFNGELITTQYILKNEGSGKTSGFFCTELTISIGKQGNTIPSLIVYTQEEKIEKPVTTFIVPELDWVQINDCESKSILSIMSNEKVKMAVLPIMSNEQNIVAAKFYFYWNFSLEERGEVEKLLTMQISRISDKRTSIKQ